MSSPTLPKVVIDGLIYRAEGYTDELAEAGLNAMHVTVCDFQAEFAGALDAIADWHQRIAADQRLCHVRTVADFKLLETPGRVGVIMGMQNARPIGSHLERVRLFKMLGVNVVQLTYMERNFFGDGCLEDGSAGLSKLGRLLVKRLQDAGVTVDLSHVGRQTAMEALALADRPMLFSHASCRALCESPRNKSDEEIKALAATGGVIGICPFALLLWRGPDYPRPTLEDYLAHVEHAVDLVGVDHVGFATDSPVGLSRTQIDAFVEQMNRVYADWYGPYTRQVGGTFEHRYADGFVGVAGIPNLKRRLIDRGYSHDDVSKILGGNFARVFNASWS